jgi:class 3 adenylate cyclase
MDAPAEHTFLFADLVGYTAFTERVGDEAAADVAIAFQAAAAHAAAELGCDIVKDLGDGVMVHGRDAARVVHSGPAVQRDRDWYGTTVNVAARLADSATAGEILMSLRTRDLLKQQTGLTIADRGPRSFKNVTAPLAVFAAAA